MKYYVDVVEVVKLKKTVPVDAASYADAARTVKRSYENKSVVLSRNDLYRLEAPQSVDFFVSSDEVIEEKTKRRLELQELLIPIGYTELEAVNRADEFIVEENLNRRKALTGRMLVEELLKQGESLQFADQIFEDIELEHQLAEELRKMGLQK